MLPSQFLDIYSRQFMHTKIRLLLEKQGNHRIHCLSSCLHLSIFCFNCQFLNHDHNRLAKIGRSYEPKSLLPIEIELGRYLQIPRNERLCKQCTSGTVENEKHFLFHCTRYSDIRHDFTTEINSVCPPDSGDEDKIISLFSSRTLIIKTAHFILDALKIRVS